MECCNNMRLPILGCNLVERFEKLISGSVFVEDALSLAEALDAHAEILDQHTAQTEVCLLLHLQFFYPAFAVVWSSLKRLPENRTEASPRKAAGAFVAELAVALRMASMDFAALVLHTLKAWIW